MCNTPFTEFPDTVQKQAMAQAWRFAQEKGFTWTVALAREWLLSICNDNGKNKRRQENKEKHQASVPVKRGRRPKFRRVREPIGTPNFSESFVLLSLYWLFC
jgi:hypothetical protein